MRMTPQPTRCCGCRWTLDFFNQILPRFTIHCTGLCLAEVEPARLDVVFDLFHPCFLWCISLELPLGWSLAPQELMREPGSVHAADVFKPAQSTSLNLLINGWLLLASFPDDFVVNTVSYRDAEDLT